MLNPTSRSYGEGGVGRGKWEVAVGVKRGMTKLLPRCNLIHIRV